MITPTVSWGWQNPVCRKQNPGWTRIIPTACKLLVRQWLHQHCADDKTHADQRSYTINVKTTHADQCLYTINVKTTHTDQFVYTINVKTTKPMLTNVYTSSVWRQQTPCQPMFIHHQCDYNKTHADQCLYTISVKTTKSRLGNDDTLVHRPQTLG